MRKQLKSELPLKQKFIRFLFENIWFFSVRWLPRSWGMCYKRTLLNFFGASISKQAQIYSSANIYYPKNLIMEGQSVIGPNTTIYNVDRIIIKDNVTVSQGAHLCTASHNINDRNESLITAPIILNEWSWVAADAFIGMGVSVGEGAVVGARAAVFKDVEPWTVVGGNPAKFIKKRQFKNL